MRFYAGALVETEKGIPLGTICVLDREPRPMGLSGDQAQALLALARAVLRELNLRLAQHLLNTGLDAVDTGIVSVDADREVSIVNRRAAALLGLPKRGAPSLDRSRERGGDMAAAGQLRDVLDQVVNRHPKGGLTQSRCIPGLQR